MVALGAAGAVVLAVTVVLEPVQRFFTPSNPADTIEGESVGRGLTLIAGFPKDVIPAIMDPTFVTGVEAEKQMRGGDDRIVGLSINGENHAYSIAHLSSHEIVNDTVGGVPVAVTWCPLCFTAMVFERQVGDSELTFGVSGSLILNSRVMFDRQTDSLWSQFLGEAVKGPLEGERLALVPSQLTRWGSWIEEFPDTLLLDRRPGRSGFFDGYQTYYDTRDAGVFGETNKDKRLTPKELVIGLDQGQSPVAYAVSDLKDEKVINDTHEGEAIVVTLDPKTTASAAFRREVGSRVLTFSSLDSQTMQDEETGSTWSAQRGVALEGPLAGTELAQLSSFASFWFAWTDFHPDTRLYGDEIP